MHALELIGQPHTYTPLPSLPNKQSTPIRLHELHVNTRSVPPAFITPKPLTLIHLTALSPLHHTETTRKQIANEKPLTKALITQALSVAEQRRMLLQVGVEGRCLATLVCVSFQRLDRGGCIPLMCVCVCVFQQSRPTHP